MRLRLTALCAVVLTLSSSARTFQRSIASPAPLPPGAERAYIALQARFDRRTAMDVVTFMQQYWRLAANPGYNASIDDIRTRLLTAGFKSEAAAEASFVRVDEFAKTDPGWDYSSGTLTIDGEPGPVLSKQQDRVSLAINSFPTAAGGLTARLVDVGNGATEGDYAGKDLKGAVVLGEASLGRLWQQAVRTRGAAGVVSTEIARYIRPSDPAAMSEPQKDVLQWGGIPHDPALKSFGFKASWRAGDRLRAALQANLETRVRVEINSNFYSGPNRTLVAEIPGRSRPEERVVMAAHVQEPGANDDASGCATLLALAKVLNDAIDRGALPRPERTLTFLWVDEIRGSQQWIASHPAEARQVQYMFSMDMTGEDTAKTGGTFLIEKQADPSAVWQRPSDPHSEWGAGRVKTETLKGSLLNDLHLAVARRRAADSGWVVRTNPYEGGSDHTAFASAGVPSLLNWHFTDRFYHSSQDTTDKVSAAEMENVGVLVATSAYFLASADEGDALATVGLIERAGLARLQLERKQGADLVTAAKNRVAAEKVEAQVVAAWQKWYGEALESVARLPVSGPSAPLSAAIAAARARIGPQ
ncbi:MAG: M28 family peptidase [Vicinamibacterales bacterium]